MKMAVFSTKHYDQIFLDQANEGHNHELVYYEHRLTMDSVALATDFPAICVFVNDQINAEVLHGLKRQGTELIALRSAGFNHVDLAVADALGLIVVRVPAYSPHAVAEHALTLIVGLNRKIYRAYNRVREGNFSLDGLLGFDLFGKTVGVVGTGKIGTTFTQIMNGLGCRVLAFDPFPDPQVDAYAEYVPLATLFRESDIVSLHCPLTPETHHLIDHNVVEQMKNGVMLINTSRGRIVDTKAVIDGLKSGKIGYLGLDVYEEEEGLFFDDLSDRVIRDDVFSRLLTFPNVLITGHQGFFTREALTNIAHTVIGNVTAYETGEGTIHKITSEMHA